MPNSVRSFKSFQMHDWLILTIKILCIVTVIVIFEYLTYSASNDVSGSYKNIDHTAIKPARYIQTRTHDGGLGNKMCRIASAYGIGKHLNRTASVNSSNRDAKNLEIESQTLFPNLFKTVAFNTPIEGQLTRTTFGLDCCRYADPEIIHDPNTTWLILEGKYYQTYKYFHPYRNEIRSMFQFGPDVMNNVNTFANELFGSDKSHKFCVHIRRGDFLTHRNLESRADFVVPAISLIRDYLRSNLSIDSASLVFIGIESDFFAELNTTQNFKPYFYNLYTPHLSSRGEDMAFGASYCDSFLISASGSTFAWWMAYLGNPTMPVFYNGQVSKLRKHTKDHNDYDMFPPEWHKLELNKTDGKVRFEKLWNFEQFGWPVYPLPATK